MPTETPVTVDRKDYRPYPYAIPEVALVFDLDPESTQVHSTLHIERKADAPADAPLVLDGTELQLVSLHVDGQAWPAARYTLDDSALILSGLPARATLDIVSRCRPEANSTLMGLHVSGGNRSEKHTSESKP